MRGMQSRGRSPLLLCSHLIADMLAVIAAYYSAIGFRFHSRVGHRIVEFLNWALRVPRFDTADEGMSFEVFYQVNAPRIITLVTLTVLTIYLAMDLYAGRRRLTHGLRGGDIARANFFALLFFFVYFYLSRNQFHPRSMFALIVVFNTGYTLFLRWSAERFLRWVRRRAGVDRCAALVIGDQESAPPLADWLEAEQPHGVYPVQRVTLETQSLNDTDLAAIRRRITEQGVAMLVLAAPRLPMATLMRFMALTDVLGIPLKILSPELGVLSVRSGLPSDRILGMPFIHFSPMPVSRVYYALKRFYSCVFSIAVLLCLSPVMLGIALGIRGTSKGPVLFIQERIGLRRKRFRMYKFRTMYAEAEKHQPRVETYNESGQGLFKMRRDPRVTTFGRFLRRYSLDELPQLLNVLRGDMTLVGPRPLPRRDLEHYYEAWHYLRHHGLPGITCLWQVVGRSDLDFHSMCLLDVFYLRNQTPGLDFRILIRTIHAVLFARGAY